MAIETISLLFKQDLNRLIKEIESYRDESNGWKVNGDIANSADKR